MNCQSAWQGRGATFPHQPCANLEEPEARDLATHAMRGALFETWVASEMLKHGCNRGEAPELHFWRDAAARHFLGRAPGR